MFMRIKTSRVSKFLYATCFNRVKSTVIKEVNNENFATWPGLTSELITAHPPKTEATVFGYLYQTRKTIISTKSEQLALDIKNDLPPKI